MRKIKKKYYYIAGIIVIAIPVISLSIWGIKNPDDMAEYAEEAWYITLEKLKTLLIIIIDFLF